MNTHQFYVGQLVYFSHGSEEKLEAKIIKLNDKNQAQISIKGWLGNHWYPTSTMRPR